MKSYTSPYPELSTSCVVCKKPLDVIGHKPVSLGCVLLQAIPRVVDDKRRVTFRPIRLAFGGESGPVGLSPLSDVGKQIRKRSLDAADVNVALEVTNASLGLPCRWLRWHEGIPLFIS